MTCHMISLTVQVMQVLVSTVGLQPGDRLNHTINTISIILVFPNAKPLVELVILLLPGHCYDCSWFLSNLSYTNNQWLPPNSINNHKSWPKKVLSSQHQLHQFHGQLISSSLKHRLERYHHAAGPAENLLCRGSGRWVLAEQPIPGPVPSDTTCAGPDISPGTPRYIKILRKLSNPKISLVLD